MWHRSPAATQHGKGIDMHRRIRRRLALALALAFALLGPATAASQEVSATSRSAGMGEALTAGSAGSAAVWHNPAGVASAMMYAAEAGYAYDGRSSTNAVTANLVDTKSNSYFGAALAFVYETANPDIGPAVEGYHVRGALAIPLLEGLVKVGSTIRYSTVDIDGDEALAALGLDAGLLIQPTEMLGLGVVGLNLVNGGYDEELPRQVGFGLALASLRHGFHISGDLLFNLSDKLPEEARTWRAGAEYLVSDLFPLRLGYRYDEVDAESSITAGAGFRDKDSAIGFDASYQHNLDNDDDRVFVGSLSVYF